MPLTVALAVHRGTVVGSGSGRRLPGTGPYVTSLAAARCGAGSVTGGPARGGPALSHGQWHGRLPG